MQRRGPTDSAGFLLWQLTLRWREALDQALLPFGLTHTNYVVIASIFWLATTGNQPNQRTIADHCGLEPMSISKAVRSLEADGLVARRSDRTDKRAVILLLTAPGQRTFHAALQTLDRVESAFLSSLGGKAEAFKDQIRTVLLAVDASSPLAAELRKK